MKWIVLIGLALVCAGVLMFGAEALTGLAEAKLTVRVLDEGGKPLPGAEVVIGFDGAGLPSDYGRQPLSVDGKTNTQGEFAASHATTGSIGFSAFDEGYYPSTGEPIQCQLQLGRWEPWNPVKEIVLKKIVHPVPMYANNRAELRLPTSEARESFGYDLIARDWVSPDGKGSVSDFVFHLTKRYGNDADYAAELSITFSNPDDGIQAGPQERFDRGSVLHSPQIAPLTGYLSRLSLLQGRTPQANGDGSTMYQTGTDKDNYLFRVRSIRSQQGKLLSAMYGKVYGQIQFSPVDPLTKSPTVLLKYYLNPDDQSRSLEFDIKHNLFANLRSIERPSRP